MNKTFKLTDPQRRRMFGIARAFGWNKEELADIVEAFTQQRHISHLTKHGGYVILAELNRLTLERRAFRPGPSAQQVAKIFKIGYLLRWDSPAIRSFNRKITGNWDIYDNDVRMASKLITAMEGVLKQDRQYA